MEGYHYSVGYRYFLNYKVGTFLEELLIARILYHNSLVTELNCTCKLSLGVHKISSLVYLPS